MTTVSMSLNFFKGQIEALNNIFEVCLVSSPSPQLQEIASREKVRYKGIEMKREIAPFYDVISLISLLIFFFSEKPAIIHCNTPKASLLGLMAGKMAGVPHRIYYIHGLRYEGATGLKQKLLKMMEKITCWLATDIIAVSFGVKEKAEQLLTRKTVSIIHNGSANGMFLADFDPGAYTYANVRDELEVKKDDFVFGFIGRIVTDKGVNELVHAFMAVNKKYPKTKLLLVGFYEDELDPLTDETKKLIFENISIIETGFQKNIQKFLSVMDVFVSPSYREGFGLTLLEANLMGKPVIASEITGYAEIITEGVNGFFVKPKSEISLINKMCFAVENRVLLKAMQQGCIDNVVQRFDHNAVLKKALEYYSQYK